MRPQTPMMRQYWEAKEAHPDALIAMRVGDFYEFYGTDAETAAGVLEITLTGREDGKNGRIPMSGVPYHSIERYLARLVRAGHKVALCEQLEDPKLAKGLVKRGVSRVLSAGTLVEEGLLESGANNFLAAVALVDGKAGLAVLDLSTGEFMATEDYGEKGWERVLGELSRLRPAEVLVPEQGCEVPMGEAVQTPSSPLPPGRAVAQLTRQFGVASLRGFGLEDRDAAVTAASMLVSYAGASGLSLGHVSGIAHYSIEGFMQLDSSTRRALELTQNSSDGSRRLTLLATLDRCSTPMGSRLLRRWVEQPLLDPVEIERRLDAVARFVEHGGTRADARNALSTLGDMERLVARAVSGVAGPRDLLRLRSALAAIPRLDDTLRKVGVGLVHDLREQLGNHAEMDLKLRTALSEDAPHHAREGGCFREGFDAELDKLREIERDGKTFIARLEQQERESSGIDKLKVGYNSVFGYYLEVPRSQADKVPAHYVRKQTTAAAERFITAEVKEHESAVLGAQEKAAQLETELFDRLRAEVAAEAPAIVASARAVASLDVLAALAEAAVRNRYVRPEIAELDGLEIVQGRHPVVEAQGGFVPNDTTLDGETRCVVLTGPNMSGKSTYLRQTALIVLMAQIGSFVPASGCRLSPCDRIFTRVGARDELALGQSTFMVEMTESANILNHATERSLVVLDEVGRGTSTFDGMAIAWAMCEHLSQVGCKTLFATHYHQLNALAGQVSGIANCRVAVEEHEGGIVWSHRVLPGGTDRSYGIHVAKMAGVPASVLRRAEGVLAELEGTERPVTASAPQESRLQMSLFVPDDSLAREIEATDVSSMTPIEALVQIDQWKKRITEAASKG
ncbi:MAG: DNA mismatch repair protein MutS [Fimbriimonadaceae bacterium]|nr:DNA mismatch repair protein MutS [Fimbriimonadaceae bacterium]